MSEDNYKIEQEIQPKQYNVYYKRWNGWVCLGCVPDKRSAEKIKKQHQKKLAGL
jgi:hypothetical protein